MAETEPAGPAGLCTSCRHARIVAGRRGNRYWLCALSVTDPRFPRYPVLPVLECDGHERVARETVAPAPTEADR